MAAAAAVSPTECDRLAAHPEDPQRVTAGVPQEQIDYPVALAACDAPLPGQVTRSLALYDGTVTVRGPEGYCVDPLSSRPDSGFAVLGACGLLVAALRRLAQPSPPDADLTARVAALEAQTSALLATLEAHLDAALQERDPAAQRAALTALRDQVAASRSPAPTGAPDHADR